MDPYEFFDDAIDGFAKWQYTPGWGNLFTVTVASIAIIASVVVSVITLSRNARQFEQTRLDARNDKLKAEIAALQTVLDERSSRQAVFTKRLTDSMSTLGDRETVDALPAVAFARLALGENWRAIFAESFSPIFEQAMGHIYAIMLLTDDKSILSPLTRIGKALLNEWRNCGLCRSTIFRPVREGLLSWITRSIGMETYRPSTTWSSPIPTASPKPW